MAKNKKEIIKKDGDSVKIFGIRLNSSSASSVLEAVTQRLKSGQKTFIVTPNPEFLVFAQKNPWFRDILNKADVAVPDGISLVWASRFLAWQARSRRNTWFAHVCSSFKNFPLQGKLDIDSLTRIAPRPKTPRGIIRERISGTDFMEKLCQEAVGQDWSVYLLGGKPGVAKKALSVLKRRYPGLRGWAEAGPRISNFELGIRNENTSEGSKFRPGVGGRIPIGASGGGHHSSRRRHSLWRRTAEVKKLIGKINQHHPDLLFVALGMGKQEKFVWDNWDQLKVKLAMGVGGAFDYISGGVPRAPKWMRNLGLEWLYRLLREPWRWRRQLALAKFVWLVLKQKIGANPKGY